MNLSAGWKEPGFLRYGGLHTRSGYGFTLIFMTLIAYRVWVGKFQGFLRSRPTRELGTEEVRGFLTELAVRHGVAASTQNQAFNALLFFYRHVLGREFGQLDGVVRAKRHRYVPVVLSRSETEAVLAQLPPPYHLVGLLL